MNWLRRLKSPVESDTSNNRHADKADWRQRVCTARNEINTDCHVIVKFAKYLLRIWSYDPYFWHLMPQTFSVVDWFKIKLQMLQYQKLRKVILEHYLLKVMYLCALLKCLVLRSKGFDATLSRIKFGSLLTAKPWGTTE